MRLRPRVNSWIAGVGSCAHSSQVFVCCAMPSNGTVCPLRLEHAHRCVVPAHEGSRLGCIDCTLDPVVLVSLQGRDVGMRDGVLAIALVVHLQVLLVCFFHHV